MEPCVPDVCGAFQSNKWIMDESISSMREEKGDCA